MARWIRVFPAVLISIAARGQDFQQLATDRAGSILYFSASARARGTDQYFHPKIFSWDGANGVRLYEQRASDVLFPSSRGAEIGRVYFSLFAPDTSSDGATVAITGIGYCSNTSSCVSPSLERYQTTIYSAGKPAVTAPGSGTLSGNGRYALLAGSEPDFFFVPYILTVLDLQTGESFRYSAGPGTRQLGSRHRVANDGTIVIPVAGGLAVARGAQSQTIPGSASVLDSNGRCYAMIDDAATLVVFERLGALSVYRMASGTTLDLATVTLDGTLWSGSRFGASLSADGSQVAFLYGNNRQVYLVGSDGKGLRQITNLPEAVHEVALSGDGKVAFAVTVQNRIVRIDVASATSTEIVAAIPYVTNPFSQVGRGSLSTVTGAGFATGTAQATAPYPASLGGVQVSIGGRAAGIAAVSPTSLSYGVPWDAPIGVFEVEIESASAAASPLVPGVEVTSFPPESYTTIAPGTPFMQVAVHEDFSSLVSVASPARPGEVLHLYAHDLGPVSPAPPAGLPAPLRPVSVLTVSLSCSLRAEPGTVTVPVEVLFAGLAPTLAGVFQLDVRMPGALTSDLGALVCQVGTPAEGYACSDAVLNCMIGGFVNLAPGVAQSSR